jgi:ferredoxin-fold anticodon binding domain-containing protein
LLVVQKDLTEEKELVMRLSGGSAVQQLKKKRVYLFLEDDLRKFRTESMCKVGIRVC